MRQKTLSQTRLRTSISSRAAILAAVLAAALSHLVYKSYELRQENELTI